MLLLQVQGQLQLQYMRKVSPRVQLGTELVCSLKAPGRGNVVVGK
jgi:hypothetical protein